MGEAADMVLDGLLDEQTGEYIGDRNIKYFGKEAPGFPVTYKDCSSDAYWQKKWRTPGKKLKRTDKCPHCERLCKGQLALQQHILAKHVETSDG